MHNGESSMIITERDEMGHYQTRMWANGRVKQTENDAGIKLATKKIINWSPFLNFLTKVFLPAGYPDSVSPDYLRYQVLNALQAFCSSLASLLSSRAILEAFGVGDPTATPTHAMLLTVLQDVCGRLSTVLGGYYIGTSLYPEAKAYRLLADILNDVAVVVDTLTPLINGFPIPGLRVCALCLSSSFRALCGVAAGGSKAAITLHFAMPASGTGNVGDLNAKDASKETVLALLGMMLGTIVVPHLTSPGRTYTMLLVLVGLHLAINYMGVRSLILRSLNRQRVAIAWFEFRASENSRVLTPRDISQVEYVFERPGVFRDSKSGMILGRCSIGSSISAILHGTNPNRLFGLFETERYLLWYDNNSLPRKQKRSLRSPPLHLHICLKEGYTNHDQIKAWVHAAEVCRLAVDDGIDVFVNAIEDKALSLIDAAYRRIVRDFPRFLEGLQDCGWSVADSTLMTGAPQAVLTGLDSSYSPHEMVGDRKNR